MFNGYCQHFRCSHPIAPIEVITGQDGDIATQEDVRNWSRSFASLLKSKVGRHYFKIFLKSEMSDEHLSFWEDVEKLKMEKHQDVIEAKIPLIYSKYIRRESPDEISITGATRIKVDEEISLGLSVNVFEAAQREVYGLLERDSYVRFVESQDYKKLLVKMETPGES